MTICWDKVFVNNTARDLVNWQFIDLETHRPTQQIVYKIIWFVCYHGIVAMLMYLSDSKYNDKVLRVGAMPSTHSSRHTSYLSPCTPPCISFLVRAGLYKKQWTLSYCQVLILGKILEWTDRGQPFLLLAYVRYPLRYTGKCSTKFSSLPGLTIAHSAQSMCITVTI